MSLKPFSDFSGPYLKDQGTSYVTYIRKVIVRITPLRELITQL